jgi:hypothetical protein
LEREREREKCREERKKSRHGKEVEMVVEIEWKLECGGSSDGGFNLHFIERCELA